MVGSAIILAALVSAAQADTITLDTGAAIQGELAVYKFDGECQISVTDGDLRGSIVLVPCERIRSFRRDGPPPKALPPFVEKSESETMLVETASPEAAPEPVALPVEEALEVEQVEPPAEPVLPDPDEPLGEAPEATLEEAAPPPISEAEVEEALVEEAGAEEPEVAEAEEAEDEAPAPVATASLPTGVLPPGLRHRAGTSASHAEAPDE